MYLTGLIHRHRLFDIATRWFYNDPHPDDGAKITEIFLFEPLISGPATRRFALDILTEIHSDTFTYEPVRSKERIREAVVCGITEIDDRLRHLVHQFHVHPEEFFPRSPVDAVIFRTQQTGRLVGMSRIKRPRRIAEKAARRMSDRLLGMIRAQAKQLAEDRATNMGISSERLLTSDMDMATEFIEAERLAAQQFQSRDIFLTPKDLKIDDTLGLKFFGRPEELNKLEQIIRDHPQASVVEREEHSGHYNAVNIQLDIKLPSPEKCFKRLRGIDWNFANSRGIPQEKASKMFLPYVESGERHVRIEVILTTYPELVESELGRSMHEERTLRMRDSAEYKGRIARNASYIIEYLLAVAYSPATEVNEIPIKMWGHYLPEALGYAVNTLYGIAEAGLMFHHYLTNWTDDRCQIYRKDD